MDLSNLFAKNSIIYTLVAILVLLIIHSCTSRKDTFDCPCDGNGLITLEGYDREETEIILTAIEEAFGKECCQLY